MTMRRIPRGCFRSMSACLSSNKEADLYLSSMENSKVFIDELEMHQPAVTDATTLRWYHQDLAVSKFLSGLSLSL